MARRSVTALLAVGGRCLNHIRAVRWQRHLRSTATSVGFRVPRPGPPSGERPRGRRSDRRGIPCRRPVDRAVSRIQPCHDRDVVNLVHIELHAVSHRDRLLDHQPHELILIYGHRRSETCRSEGPGAAPNRSAARLRASRKTRRTVRPIALVGTSPRLSEARLRTRTGNPSLQVAHLQGICSNYR